MQEEMYLHFYLYKFIYNYFTIMIQTITRSTFIDAFKTSNERKEQFSYNALVALFNYYEELEDSMGEQMELDVVAICCEWTEYETVREAYENYQDDYSELWDDEQDRIDEALEYLRDRTQVILIDFERIIIANF